MLSRGDYELSMLVELEFSDTLKMARQVPESSVRRCSSLDSI